MSKDQWLEEFEAVRESANETHKLIQERNTQYGGEGPEASRITAAARRKLGTLGTILDRLKHGLDGPESENERNRRRDLISALRGRREQMLQALKRDGAAAQRGALFAGSSGQGAPSGQETIQTAELNATGLLSLQQEIMSQQDRDLESLEHSVAGTKHIALQINEETTLHNRLLEDLDEEVSATSSRMKAA
ncbi:hypothetical protein H632_c726p1, partial [Helicosporidium sp. ATCC 50920]